MELFHEVMFNFLVKLARVQRVDYPTSGVHLAHEIYRTRRDFFKYTCFHNNPMK